MRIYIFVGVYEGIPDLVEVYLEKKRAEKRFQKYTGVSFNQVEIDRAIKEGNPEWTGSDIFEREI